MEEAEELFAQEELEVSRVTKNPHVKVISATGECSLSADNKPKYICHRTRD